MDQTIFKAYDIRGIYPKQINEDLAYKLGRAFVVFLKTKKVMVAKDMRLSSESLADSLIRGILEQGADVLDIGLSSHPMFLYGIAKYKLDGGILITASHNPKNYNGFKLVKKEAMPIGQETGLNDLKNLVLTGNFENSSEKGVVIKEDILDKYLDYIFTDFDTSQINNIKIIADAGNGMAGPVFEKFFSRLNCQITPLYWELDGNFPHHLANPILSETLYDLISKVKEEKADLGIATDGDSDRIFFIDEKAQKIKSEYIIALIAQMLLKEKRGLKILYDLRCSKIVKETIKENGGQPVICRVGHSFIKEKMRQENILFGGEVSGHFYLNDIFTGEAPFTVVLYLLKIMSEYKKPISEIILPFKKYFSIEETNFEVADKDEILKKAEKYYTQGKINHLDGITIEFKDWWFNLRPSNTEPLLRLNLEANTDSLMKEKFKEIKDLIK